MSNLVEHAKRELTLAGLFNKDSDYGGMMGDSVMELMEVFSKQDHSEMSASMATSIFDKVSQFKTLTPLNGEDAEWTDVGSVGSGETQYQNNRVSAVFKNSNKDKSYYIDAIIWQGEDNWDTFTGTVDDVSSSQGFNKFPFTPKTFYVDVVREYNSKKYFEENDLDYYEYSEKEGGCYRYLIKDKKQLDEVYKYYNN